MGATLNERNPNINSIVIGTQAATITLPVAYFRKHSRMKQAVLLDQAGITADNSNYFTITLQDLNSNVYGTYDSRVAHQGAVIAFTPAQMVLTLDTTLENSSQDASQQECDIPAGTTLELVITLTGTKTTTKALLQLEYYPC